MSGAATNDLTPEGFAEWLRDRAERDFSAAPALGRIREVLHLRLSNADDKWGANDPNDVLFLAAASAYANVMIGERKTSGYLRRAAARTTQGAAVFHRMSDAVDAVERLAVGPWPPEQTPH